MKTSSEIDFTILNQRNLICPQHINDYLMEGLRLEEILKSVYNQLEEEDGRAGNRFENFMLAAYALDPNAPNAIPDLVNILNLSDSLKNLLIMVLRHYHLVGETFESLEEVASFGEERFDELEERWKAGFRGIVELIFPKLDFDDRYTVLNFDIGKRDLTALRDAMEESTLREYTSALLTLVESRQEEMTHHERNQLARALKSTAKLLNGEIDPEDYQRAIQQVSRHFDTCPWLELIASTMLTLLAISLLVAVVLLIVALATPAAPISVAILAPFVALFGTASTAATVTTAGISGIACIAAAFSGGFFAKQTIDQQESSFKRTMEKIKETHETLEPPSLSSSS